MKTAKGATWIGILWFVIALPGFSVEGESGRHGSEGVEGPESVPTASGSGSWALAGRGSAEGGSPRRRPAHHLGSFVESYVPSRSGPRRRRRLDGRGAAPLPGQTMTLSDSLGRSWTYRNDGNPGEWTTIAGPGVGHVLPASGGVTVGASGPSGGQAVEGGPLAAGTGSEQTSGRANLQIVPTQNGPGTWDNNLEYGLPANGVVYINSPEGPIRALRFSALPPMGHLSQRSGIVIVAPGPDGRDSRWDMVPRANGGGFTWRHIGTLTD